METHSSDTPQETAAVSYVNEKALGCGTTSSGRSFSLPFLLPNEEFIFPKKKERHQPLSMLNTSPDRVSPACPHFTVCGGCSFQHAAYPWQSLWKKTRIEEALSPFNPKIDTFTPSSTEFFTRNKMEFSFNENKKGEKFFGLYRKESRYIENLASCHLFAPWMSDFFKIVRNFWEESGLSSFCPHKGRGSLRSLVIRQNRQGDLLWDLFVSGEPEDALNHTHIELLKKASIEFEKRVNAPSLSLFLTIQQCIPKQPTRFFDIHLRGPESLTEKLSISYQGSTKTHICTLSPRAFFQPHAEQCEKIYSRILEYIEPTPEETIWDLYSGTGTISMALSPFAGKVYGIEYSKEAVVDARENTQINNINNATFYAGDAEKLISTLPAPDKIVVDPPRSGLSPKTISGILERNPQKIVYVSCHLPSLVRDADLLTSSYRLTKASGFDQFPQTPHVETVALFDRKDLSYTQIT